MVSTTKFIDKLKQIQSANGLTDLEMAQRLSCSRQLYQKTRTEQIPLGNKILHGVIRAFPEELNKDAIYFLTSDAHQLAEVADRNTHQTTQDGKRGLLKRLYDRFCYRFMRWYCYPKAKSGSNSKN